MELKFLKGTTLHERQMRYYNGHECPYCGSLCDYVDSKEVYQESHGMIYICRPCKAWVGVHSGSDQAYGFVAKKELRDLRHEAHKFFDPLWQKKVSYGAAKGTAQAAARRWMAFFMNIPVEEAHIGMMDNDQCRKIIEECKKYYLTEEQKKEIAAFEELNSGFVRDCAQHLCLKINEFNLNGSHKFEITHPKTNKTFHYFPRINSGGYDLKKIKTLEDNIEAYLLENFKL